MSKEIEQDKDHQQNPHRKEEDTIELFVQREGDRDVTIIRVSGSSNVSDIITAAEAQGLTDKEGNTSFIFLEDEEEVLDASSALQSCNIRHRSRIHVHRCHKILVTVNFNGTQKSIHFPPSMTIGRVKSWAVSDHAFNMSEIDATEHALQICDSSIRPDGDLHLGSFVTFPGCAICFDLVPKKRVEG